MATTNPVNIIVATLAAAASAVGAFAILRKLSASPTLAPQSDTNRPRHPLVRDQHAREEGTRFLQTALSHATRFKQTAYRCLTNERHFDAKRQQAVAVEGEWIWLEELRWYCWRPSSWHVVSERSSTSTAVARLVPLPMGEDVDDSGLAVEGSELVYFVSECSLAKDSAHGVSKEFIATLLNSGAISSAIGDDIDVEQLGDSQFTVNTQTSTIMVCLTPLELSPSLLRSAFLVLPKKTSPTTTPEEEDELQMINEAVIDAVWPTVVECMQRTLSSHAEEEDGVVEGLSADRFLLHSPQSYWCSLLPLWVRKLTFLMENETSSTMICEGFEGSSVTVSVELHPMCQPGYTQAIGAIRSKVGSECCWELVAAPFDVLEYDVADPFTGDAIHGLGGWIFKDRHRGERYLLALAPQCPSQRHVIILTCESAASQREAMALSLISAIAVRSRFPPVALRRTSEVQQSVIAVALCHTSPAQQLSSAARTVILPLLRHSYVWTSARLSCVSSGGLVALEGHRDAATGCLSSLLLSEVSDGRSGDQWLEYLVEEISSSPHSQLLSVTGKDVTARALDCKGTSTLPLPIVRYVACAVKPNGLYTLTFLSAVNDRLSLIADDDDADASSTGGVSETSSGRRRRKETRPQGKIVDDEDRFISLFVPLLTGNGAFV